MYESPSEDWSEISKIKLVRFHSERMRLIPQLSGLTEYWVDISNYEGYYQVSNYGNVGSLDRVIKEKTGKTQTLKGRISRQTRKNLAM
jgi:hypothetical protein